MLIPRQWGCSSSPRGRISSAFVNVEAQWISVTPSESLHGMFSPLHHPPLVSPISADTLSGESHSHPDPHKVAFLLALFLVLCPGIQLLGASHLPCQNQQLSMAT